MASRKSARQVTVSRKVYQDPSSDEEDEEEDYMSESQDDCNDKTLMPMSETD